MNNARNSMSNQVKTKGNLLNVVSYQPNTTCEPFHSFSISEFTNCQAIYFCQCDCLQSVFSNSG